MILSSIAWVGHLSLLYGETLDRFLLREVVGNNGLSVGVLSFVELRLASSHEGVYLPQPASNSLDPIPLFQFVNRAHLHRLAQLDWQEGWEVRGNPPMCHLTYTPPQAVPGLQEWLVKSWL